MSSTVHTDDLLLLNTEHTDNLLRLNTEHADDLLRLNIKHTKSSKTEHIEFLLRQKMTVSNLSYDNANWTYRGFIKYESEITDYFCGFLALLFGFLY